jgi:thioredoxin-like negative regulator of GroEL
MAFSSEIEKLERRWQENPLGLTFASLAELYRKAGDPGRALELIEQGLTQHPNYVPAHIVRARCHLDTLSDSDAEQAFLRVTELDPENVMALKGLAELSERGGRIAEAVHRLETLLDVDRNNEEARGQLDRVKELLASTPAPAPIPAPVEVASEPKAPEPEAPVVATVPVVEPKSAEPEPASAGSFDEGSLSDLELEAATQLTSVPSDEYQIPNDSEALQPTDQRIADIVLGTEAPDDFPIDEGAYGEAAPAPELPAAAGRDSVDVLLGEDYTSMMAYRDATELPAVEPPPLEETIFGQMALMAQMPIPAPDVMPPPPAAPFAQESFLPPPPPEPEPQAEPQPEPMPVMESESAPDTDVAAESPPTAEWAEPESPAPASIPESAPPGPEPELDAAAAEPEPVAMLADYVPLGELGAPSRFEPAAPQFEEPEPAPAAEPELVVTETMAEIFLRQGHRELALAVYAQLAQREPDNERIAAALASLTPETPAPEAPAPPPAPRFAASDTGGRSVGELFGALLSSVRPSVAPTIHPPAFELPKRASGEPTRPAQESLSLSSVFGEEAGSGGSAGATADSVAGEPSFDEFFAPATGPAADLELPRAPASDSSGEPAQVPEDLEQFNAWLRGLKR